VAAEGREFWTELCGRQVAPGCPLTLWELRAMRARDVPDREASVRTTFELC